MKQIGEYKLQFESFEDLEYFIKFGISYYGDQYCVSDIETDEDWTLENITHNHAYCAAQQAGAYDHAQRTFRPQKECGQSGNKLFEF